MNRENVMVAMSGGVDSSVCALLLKEQGYNCMGVTMKMFSPCFLLPDAKEDTRAAEIAAKLGIPFETYICEEEFRRCVMDYFVNTYLEGGTPNPCVECNRTMKFGKLLEFAREKSCEKIATGHYAKITQDPNGRFLLSAAEDGAKDQTYVLWQLSQDQLSRILFPLGGLKKTEIREIAAANGFVNASQKDSQDICFIPDGDYISFIERYTQKEFPSGSFLDMDGKVLGQHKGMFRYTIGQRKGLGIAFGKPTYVCKKDAILNTVTLGDNSDLFSSILTAHSVNLIACDAIHAPIRVQAKVRYKAAFADATVEQIDTDRIRVVFDQPQRAISPGQSVVLYDGGCVIGGGIID